MIGPMARVELIGPGDRHDEALSTLQDLGVAHLEEVPFIEKGGKDLLHRIHLDASEAREREALSEGIEIAGVARGMAPFRESADPEALRREIARAEGRGTAELAGEVQALLRRLRSLTRRLRNLGDDLALLSRFQRIASDLLPIVETERGEGVDFIGVIIDSTRAEVIDGVREALAELSEGHCWFRHVAHPREGRTYGVVAFRGAEREALRAKIGELGFQEVSLPGTVAGSDFLASLRDLRDKLDSLPAVRARLERELETLVAEGGDRLAAIERVLHDRLAHFEARQSLARSRYLFVVHGWIPAGQVERLRGTFRERFGDLALIRVRGEGDSPEDVPVRLENRQWARPFELLLSPFPPPTYGTFDPTSLLAATMPIFFGFIVGDIGYGLLILAAALFVYHRFRRRALVRRLVTIVGWCAGWTMAFGLLYGELFGSLGARWGILPWGALWKPRHGEAVRELLLVSVGVGVFHVALGLLLGAILRMRRRLWREAFESLGLLLVLAALAGLGLRTSAPEGIQHAFAIAGMALLLAGALFVVFSERGPLGLMEIPSVVGNSLSYTRLLAVGMVSLVLADLANRLPELLGSIVLGVLGAIVLHAANLVLICVSPTIHTLRLHYVEFMSKFYEARGREYRPFRRLTKEIE